MPAYTTQQVLTALGNVEEPDLKKDLVTLNMVRDIAIDNNRISFTVVLTTPACPLKDLIERACVNAIHYFIDREIEVKVNFTSRVTGREGSRTVLSGVKNIIAVASGKGGVGKSTVAANIAVALAGDGAAVGLLDADIYGPSIPVMFGISGTQPSVVNKEGKNFMVPLQRYGVKVVSMGFIVKPEEAVVWRGPMISSALKQFINEVDWGELDYLIIDLPPGTGDIHITVSQGVPLSGALVVTTPQDVAVADARKALSMFRMPGLNVPILGVIENMAWFTPAELPENKYYVFGQGGGQKLASEFSVPLLGSIPLFMSVGESGDKGQPAAMRPDDEAGKAFVSLARSVAQQLAILNSVTRSKTGEAVS
jgi:ATP-binding protein involved in chromosome partitioning